MHPPLHARHSPPWHCSSHLAQRYEIVLGKAGRQNLSSAAVNSLAARADTQNGARYHGYPVTSQQILLDSCSQQQQWPTEAAFSCQQQQWPTDAAFSCQHPPPCCTHWHQSADCISYTKLRTAPYRLASTANMNVSVHCELTTGEHVFKISYRAEQIFKISYRQEQVFKICCREEQVFKISYRQEQVFKITYRE